jgi:hypothetical protein
MNMLARPRGGVMGEAGGGVMAMKGLIFGCLGLTMVKRLVVRTRKRKTGDGPDLHM